MIQTEENNDSVGSPVISERHQNPALTMQSSAAKKEKFTWAAVLIILVTLMFIILMIMQWVDFQELNLA